MTPIFSAHHDIIVVKQKFYNPKAKELKHWQNYSFVNNFIAATLGKKTRKNLLISCLQFIKKGDLGFSCPFFRVKMLFFS